MVFALDLQSTMGVTELNAFPFPLHLKSRSHSADSLFKYNNLPLFMAFALDLQSIMGVTELNAFPFPLHLKSRSNSADSPCKYNNLPLSFEKYHSRNNAQIHFSFCAL